MDPQRPTQSPLDSGPADRGTDQAAHAAEDGVADDPAHSISKNFFVQLSASVATKIGDELASTKLILPWLMTALGAPLYLLGLLVPIRESGALLPQLLVAGYSRGLAIRKWVWVIGSALQGAAILGMALVVTALTGNLAGWAIVGLLTLFSLARGICSVTSKDVLGKTMPKHRRGKLMGYSAALAGAATVVIGAYISTLDSPARDQDFFVDLLLSAGMLWMFAALTFVHLVEPRGTRKCGGSSVVSALSSVRLLLTDAELRRFVLVRTLLLSSALSFPYYVVLAREQAGEALSSLGLMIVAGGLANGISAPIWGWLADRSSRLAMMLAALLASATGFIVFLLTASQSAWLQHSYSFALFFLVLGVAHSGVRLGRKTYLVDMATPANRPTYVALSNTIIGILILVAGMLSTLAARTEAHYIILVLAIIAAIAGVSSLTLREVE